MTDPAENDTISAADCALLAALRTLYTELDPPPPGLVDRISFSLTWAALEAEVAQLQAVVPVGVRDDTAYGVADTLTFSSRSVDLMITLAPPPGPTPPEKTRVDGWVSDPDRLVELRVNGETFPVRADSTGRLVWEGVPRGRAQFLIHPIGTAARPVITPTIDL